MRMHGVHCNLRPPDVTPVVLRCFGQICIVQCTQIAISRFTIKILTSPLDSSPRFPKIKQ